MKTTLRFAAFAVLFALITLPAFKAFGGSAATSKKAASTTYKVCFSPNGGGGKMSAQKFSVNKSAALSVNRFTRKGYVFAGWAVSKSGAVAYTDGQSVKNLAKGGKTVTLYAKWAVKNYLVAFYANGGSGSMSLQKHVYGKAAKLSANQFSRRGYAFSGWATKSTGKVKFSNKASVKNLTDTGKTIKLYAVWVADSSSTPSSGSTTSTGDEVDFSKLKWVYGGFDGSAAKLSSKARISNLRASNSGVSYTWASGGCQDLGASSASDASCVACLFCYSGGKWQGGKFDWTCSNNKSASFKNIEDQYKGWSSSVLSKAEEYAFVILKKNGTARTNVIRVRSPGYSSSTPATPTTPSSSSADDVDFSKLKWVYGHFDGASAKLASKPRISSLKVNNNGMSYSWKSGGCENLGCTSATDASCLACLFCYSGGKWQGGKFDWISTSRKTRDFKNIHTNYKGWSSSVLSRAEAYAFVIVSKDGKSRSNVIRCNK